MNKTYDIWYDPDTVFSFCYDFGITDINHARRVFRQAVMDADSDQHGLIGEVVMIGIHENGSEDIIEREDL